MTSDPNRPESSNPESSAPEPFELDPPAPGEAGSTPPAAPTRSRRTERADGRKERSGLVPTKTRPRRTRDEADADAEATDEGGGFGRWMRRIFVAPFTSSRSFYLLGALLVGGLLMLLFNDTVATVHGLGGLDYPWEAFSADGGGFDWSNRPEQRFVLSLTLLFFALLACVFSPRSRTRGWLACGATLLGSAFLLYGRNMPTPGTWVYPIAATFVAAVLFAHSGPDRDRPRSGLLVVAVILGLLLLLLPLNPMGMDSDAYGAPIQTQVIEAWQKTDPQMVDSWQRIHPDGHWTPDGFGERLMSWPDLAASTTLALLTVLGLLVLLGLRGAVIRWLVGFLMLAYVLGSLWVIWYMGSGLSDHDRLSPTEFGLVQVTRDLRHHLMALYLPFLAIVADLMGRPGSEAS